MMIEKHSPKHNQIMEIINDWDPVNFFIWDVPRVEYDLEIDFFLPLLLDATKKDYLQILHNTFERYFGQIYPDLYRDNEKTEKAAEEIYEIISGA